MSYIPQVNDYVKWNDLEGWVYFYCEDYITIEISVKPKKDKMVPHHKMWHCCVLCYHQKWDELQYIKNRKS
jgi:hypothetical protein|tara:strand:- start:1763 stop:1975 length:213 start_codon:yes stop_codon:yes gene_type:complete